MTILIITLSTAIACVQLDCTNAIVGKAKTPSPVGVFASYYANTNQYGYGNELIIFKETSKSVYAIHKPFKTLNNKHYRENLLENSQPNQRKISNGCINVSSEFFEKYKDSIDSVIIEE